MAKQIKQNVIKKIKKTYQGLGKGTRYGHKGGGLNGSPQSKKYKKKYVGQGRKR
tara:strand:+ start:1165 stop:1326 length:162 start_codon:yes stop_codon:yes gene_type:complete